MGNILEASGLVKRFDDLLAVNDVSFSIGEQTCSGSGEQQRAEPILIEPVRTSDVIIEGLDRPETEMSASEEMASPRTSAEMVAEARARYGRRP